MVVAERGVPAYPTYLNELPYPAGVVQTNLLPVDQTLDWANPLKYGLPAGSSATTPSGMRIAALHRAPGPIRSTSMAARCHPHPTAALIPGLRKEVQSPASAIPATPYSTPTGRKKRPSGFIPMASALRG